MRPALLRLLRRPSALSVIDSLISSPLGIEQLENGLRHICCRCETLNPRFQNRASRIKPGKPAHNELPSRATRHASGFRVHEIRTLPTNSGINSESGRSISNGDSPVSWKQLGLDPERLELESDVGHTRDIGTRLVDDPSHQTDFSLWLELLRYRQRRYGDNGTLDIWEGLMTRVGGLHLPVEGETSDVLWQSFVDLGFKRQGILNELADYSLVLWNKTGKRWPRLYQSIVGEFIQRGMTHQAVNWHKRLQHPHLSRPNDIFQCFKPIASFSTNPVRHPAGFARPQEWTLASRLSALRTICKYTKGHRVYGLVLSALLEEGSLKEALQMHHFLVQRGDHPRSYDDLRSLLQYTKGHGSISTYNQLRQYAKRRFFKQHKQTEAVDLDTPTDESSKSNPGEWMEEKQFKDDFGARIFATKALNFEMILSGLKMFGVPAIGPQSLREMATRARGSQDILKKLGQLEEGGISIGNSVFSRLLRRLAIENREIVLSDLIGSDQHPDMLEDAETQESLLVGYYTVRDWRQYNLTLAVLRELLGEGPKLFDVHIRKHIAAGEWAMTSKVVDEMLAQSAIPSSETITFMVKQALSLRKPGVGPVQQPNVCPTQEVTFVFRVLQRIVQAGAEVSPRLWIELIKRFGMTDNWDELRSCCLWLARHYSPHHTLATPKSSESAQSITPILPRAHNHQILRRIFTRQLQDAIIAWGFTIQPPSRVRTYLATGVKGDKLVPFVRGIVLLRELKQIGVHLQLRRIPRTCRQRFTILYGRPIFSNRPKNRALRRENPYVAEQVIADINRAWGEPLFSDQERNRLDRAMYTPSYRPRPRARLGPSTVQ
ncbi:hypothetical protein P175DRAFT_0497323 [Aspergillus ochraceoroseus IBT 24754]|uniref:Pentatricopeptide repeat domain-containing protein n=3 Tax=Aspergillus subgen. Nidulantes TaxID=2720870 RepID=A0A0F8WRT0_9EURO|nr:uncharacterized protein P175DRAFT_0497323 [Aspergillus ochraceoroseus IBT 24754]KKK19214.1 hypothetical protein AOCH_002893 [Aspergillus ochraceoroseus]KKK20360.1 hypothetical protein ARAM_003314 [Aspergillus rambellii]PTU24212.1 hypothetical protein P175DRAFT_0497323 [Aspergillus ochraceoroseus IBT 24754]